LKPKIEKLGFSDFNKIFWLWVQYMEIFLLCFSKVFILLILMMSVFEIKHTRTFWTIEYLLEGIWKFILKKYFKTNMRIYTEIGEWKQQVFLSIGHVWIHSSSKIWMPQLYFLSLHKIYLLSTTNFILFHCINNIYFKHGLHTFLIIVHVDAI
jgi:hypothetical protein